MSHPSHRVHQLLNQLTPQPTNASTTSSSPPSSSPLNEVVIVSYARTPMGSGPLNGSLSSFTAPDLGAIAIRGALRRGGVAAKDVDECIMGNVLSAGIGQAPARQAALKAGLPVSTPCTTVNKVCASGMKAFMFGCDAIRVGNRDCVVVGGMESMSNAPFLLNDTRNGRGLKFGHSIASDALIHDGLTDAYHQGVHMGTVAELTAQKLNITRAEQDAYAKQSYERAQAATKAKKFANEIEPIEIKGKDGKVKVFRDDEEVFRSNFDRFPTLKPTFPTVIKGVSDPNSPPPIGTVTAANSSVIADGAAAIVLMSKQKAESLGLKPIGRILSHADAALSPLEYTIAPEVACRQAIQKAGLNSVDEVDIWELNEAFSLVSCANQKLLGIPNEKICLFGGAISLGHPIGCSGSRIICTLMTVLESEGKSIGCAALCNGGGGASAVVIQRI